MKASVSATNRARAGSFGSLSCARRRANAARASHAAARSSVTVADKHPPLGLEQGSSNRLSR